MDEKRKKLLRRLDEFSGGTFYSNYTKNTVSYSLYFKNEFFPYSDLEKLSFSEFLNCYLN